MKHVLTVGLEYTGKEIDGVKIENLGLCKAKYDDERSAFSLSEYDVIIIYPKSFSHFIFGHETEYSESKNELYDLKSENNNYDLDTIFDAADRTRQLDAAIESGTIVIWCLAEPKHIQFFGWRSTTIGYVNDTVEAFLKKSKLLTMKGRTVIRLEGSEPFESYLHVVSDDGWRYCLTDYPDRYESIAETREGYSLAGTIELDGNRGWLVTPPASEAASNELVRCAVRLNKKDAKTEKYHSVFLSHTSSDKPFVRELRKTLLGRGVQDVWIDEAEIEVGDSLTSKIESGIETSRYFVVVLSAESVKAPWVKKELEVAMNMEIGGDRVVVLPVLYKECDVPGFLKGKLYADFTTPERAEASVEKLLNRLRIK